MKIDRRHPKYRMSSEIFSEYEIHALNVYFPNLTQEHLDKLAKRLDILTARDYPANPNDQKDLITKHVVNDRQPLIFKNFPVHVHVPVPDVNVKVTLFDGSKHVLSNFIDPDKLGHYYRRSLTDCAELTDTESPFWIQVQNALSWNTLRGDLLSHAGMSTIISQPGAATTTHQHCWAFWNMASMGEKFYILYDTTKTDQRVNDGYTMKLDNLSIDEFLEHGILTRISDESESGNFIVCPKYYAHHVVTSSDGLMYYGSGGFVETEEDPMRLLHYTDEEINCSTRSVKRIKIRN